MVLNNIAHTFHIWYGKINNLFGRMVEFFQPWNSKTCCHKIFPMLTSCLFTAEQYKIPLFRYTMVVCGRRHVTYVCFISSKNNPLSYFEYWKKNKNAMVSRIFMFEGSWNNKLSFISGWGRGAIMFRFMIVM